MNDHFEHNSNIGNFVLSRNLAAAIAALFANSARESVAVSDDVKMKRNPNYGNESYSIDYTKGDETFNLTLKPTPKACLLIAANVQGLDRSGLRPCATHAQIYSISKGGDQSRLKAAFQTPLDQILAKHEKPEPSSKEL